MLLLKYSIFNVQLLQLSQGIRTFNPVQGDGSVPHSNGQYIAAVCVTFVMAFYIPAVLRHEWKVRICTARIILRSNLSYLL